MFECLIKGRILYGVDNLPFREQVIMCFMRSLISDIYSLTDIKLSYKVCYIMGTGTEMECRGIDVSTLFEVNLC